MITIACPAGDAGAIYAELAVRTKTLVLREALLAQGAHVAARAAQYLQDAPLEILYHLRPELPVGVTREELSKVYDRVLVKGKGRPLYEKIKAGAHRNRCPLCGQRDVRTLDHYLPKSHFPELAVFPANLIPSCSDCNFHKRTHLALTYDQQTFHPYFDDWQNFCLVQANISIDDTVDVQYSIESAEGFDEKRLARVRRHFNLLHLGELYSTHAGQELVEAKALFYNFFNEGPEILRDELAHIARSRERYNLNSWNAALYRALSQTPAFWNGGFRKIDE